MRLGIARTVRLTFASFFIQTSWSFSSLQTLGFVFNLLSGARREHQQELQSIYPKIFNTHPYMASYIIGAILRTHDENSLTPDRIDRFILIAQTSFATAGDLLFWQTIRPALLLCAVILGLKIGIAGPVAAFIAYNILHLYHRIHGLCDGYEKGADVIYVLRSRRFTLVQRVFEFLGAFATGGLIALATTDFHALLIVPLCLIFVGLLFKRIASVIIIIIAIIITLAIVVI
ncbi:PTS system mannose/fructose/sorbose family transporter subunit IID [candidate division WOR-3 bacterium]|nr:PTS system mannose/fructose/sorbose family transporter subunit IID [candidate division WOR-3 bacterium]